MSRILRTPATVMKLTRRSARSQFAISRRSSFNSEGEPFPAVNSQGIASPVSGISGDEPGWCRFASALVRICVLFLALAWWNSGQWIGHHALGFERFSVTQPLGITDSATPLDV